jgi:formylglycine-generating enzyme required for sulfatase activity
VERAEAGDVLAALGDPRFRADAWYLPNDPMLGFVEIPAGPFIMGEGEDAHEVDLPTFYMARYPVTVAQWTAFVEATGHKPTDRDSLRDPANRPVRYVTWDEAILYCKWLSRALAASPDTPQALAALLQRKHPWTVLLPSEAEWEKAARGGLDGNQDRRRPYPWGKEVDAERANYADAGIGTTCTVGAFPAGKGPYGMLDLSGNVWEWTRTRWGEDYGKPKFVYPYRLDDDREDLNSRDIRVLRGGAYFSNDGNIRASARIRLDPRIRDYFMGFRCVLVPISRVVGSVS